jgi:hypothetical protein
MATAHSFTLPPDDGMLNNGHESAAVLQHELQLRDLRALIFAKERS